VFSGDGFDLFFQLSLYDDLLYFGFTLANRKIFLTKVPLIGTEGDARSRSLLFNAVDYRYIAKIQISPAFR